MSAPVDLEGRRRHDRVPLLEQMQEFRSALRAPLYCPGHKGGRSLPTELRDGMATYDLNNVPDLDTLHCPSGPIRDAESLVADAYGVDRSFLLVGGSSVGNMAAVMAAARPGDTVLVPRNAHKSVVAGLIHSGAVPRWIRPARDARFGISHGVATATVAEALAATPEAVALVALNPTYFGVVSDIAAVARLCHEHDVALLTDEAHGPHLRFADGRFPTAAEDVGADVVVQSTHKILSGLSQAAVLHLQGSRVEVARASAALQALQTTSPHFAILASIDTARRQMVTEGKPLLDRMHRLAVAAREAIATIDGVRVLGQAHALGPGSGFETLDETKLVIDATDVGWGGREALELLNREFGVQPELAGPGYLLAILSVGSNEHDVDHLVRALRALAERPAPTRRAPSGIDDLAAGLVARNPDAVMTPREAFYADQVAVPLATAQGRVCAEVVTPYPPGIPVIMPGERFDHDTIALVQAVSASGNPISAVDPTMGTVRVVR